jgi:hypothetical protein
MLVMIPTIAQYYRNIATLQQSCIAIFCRLKFTQCTENSHSLSILAKWLEKSLFVVDPIMVGNMG